MVWDELGRAADEANQRDRDRWIGVYIGVLAVISPSARWAAVMRPRTPP